MSALLVWLSWSMVVALGLLAARRGVPSRGVIDTGLGLARRCGTCLPASRSLVVPRTRSPGEGKVRDPDEHPPRPRFFRGRGQVGFGGDGLR
jgi:hypothetical protein